MQEMNKPSVSPSGCQLPFQGSLTEITIRLPDETVNYLQRLDYEVAGLQVLHTHALNAGVPLERRMEIRREHQEVFAEYQLAKNEMWAEFAPRFPKFRRWWVDFQTGLLHVEVPGDANAVGRDAPGTPHSQEALVTGGRAEASRPTEGEVGGHE